MDLDLNRLVAYLLRAGVMVGAFLALLGLAVWATQGFANPSPPNSYDILSVLHSALAGDASGIAYLGIIILIATPILRVTVSTFYFGKEKDAKFVAITAVVLAMLIFALFSGQIA
jgi:uncharacterized protein